MNVGVIDSLIGNFVPVCSAVTVAKQASVDVPAGFFLSNII
jgi:hypothetical protein